MSAHIVKNVRVTGEPDKETTIISLNGHLFAFSPESFDRLFVRMCERKAFMDALRKIEQRSQTPSIPDSEGE